MINITDLPAISRYWSVEKLIDYCLENGYEGIRNNKLPKSAGDDIREQSLAQLLDNPYIWETWK